MKNNIRNMVILIFLLLLQHVDVSALECNSSIAQYCDINANGTSNGKVRVTTGGNDVYIEYYNFSTPCGNGGHSKEVVLNTGGVKDKYREDVTQSPRRDYCVAKGTESVVESSSNNNLWYYRWDDNSTYLKQRGLKKGDFTTMNEGSPSVSRTADHFHYYRVKVTGSDANGKYKGMKYITIGSDNQVLAWKTLGCTIGATCTKYKKKACDCNTAYNCKVYYSSSDVVSSTTCAEYNTCNGTCKRYDTTTDATKKQYYLKGTDVTTGQQISATCVGTTCTF